MSILTLGSKKEEKENFQSKRKQKKKKKQHIEFSKAFLSSLPYQTEFEDKIEAKLSSILPFEPKLEISQLKL